MNDDDFRMNEFEVGIIKTKKEMIKRIHSEIDSWREPGESHIEYSTVIEILNKLHKEAKNELYELL